MLGEENLVLPAPVVRGADLDRAAGGKRDLVRILKLVTHDEPMRVFAITCVSHKLAQNLPC